MSEPKLIELAAEIADYCVTNEYPLQDTTYEAENGDIRYTEDCQETFNERYVYILDLLEETFDGKVLRIQEQQHGGKHDRS
jgi:hypothetical protein